MTVASLADGGMALVIRLPAVPGWRAVRQAAGFVAQSTVFAAGLWLLLALPGVLG